MDFIQDLECYSIMLQVAQNGLMGAPGLLAESSASAINVTMAAYYESVAVGRFPNIHESKVATSAESAFAYS